MDKKLILEKNICLRLSQPIFEKLKDLAEQETISVSALIRRTCIEYLKYREEKNLELDRIKG